MRSSRSRSVAQPSVSRRAAATTSGWSESISGVGSRDGRRSSVLIASPRRAPPLVSQRGREAPPQPLETVARRDVGYREEEVPDARGDVSAQSRETLLG